MHFFFEKKEIFLTIVYETIYLCGLYNTRFIYVLMCVLHLRNR